MAVYAVHPIKELDISGALAYGEVLYSNRRYVYADELEGTNIPAAFFSKMERVVDNFDPDQDYLLIAGDHLQIVAMAALLAARWGGFKVLRYDREAKGYVLITIDTPDLLEPL